MFSIEHDNTNEIYLSEFCRFKMRYCVYSKKCHVNPIEIYAILLIEEFTLHRAKNTPISRQQLLWQKEGKILIRDTSLFQDTWSPSFLNGAN